MAMNKSDATEEEKEIGSQIQLIVGRVPKKNHDAALQIYKQSSDLFRRYGLLRSELFQLNNTKTYDEMGLTNIPPRRRSLGRVTILQKSQAPGSSQSKVWK
jgi:hypothetical protein